MREQGTLRRCPHEAGKRAPENQGIFKEIFGDS